FSRFWELLAGGALAYASLHYASAFERYHAMGAFHLGGRVWHLRDLAGVLGLCLIAFACMRVSDADRFPGWLALLPTVGAVLLISAGESGWVNRAVLSRRWIVLIGLISYPLYLWHWPLLFFGRNITTEQPLRYVLPV